ncbi:hypothetical protein SPAN111604_06075 [Sphingomonas antarctica]|uniref:hypothetical protein n=1 Tax=Sphingomonas antarctica TaxID=2040274 RepID=UPI0039E889C2
MRKFLVPIIALASIAAAAPATAQYWGGNQGQGYSQYNGGGIDQRIRAVSFQIDRLSQRGALNYSEQRSLRRELGYVSKRAQRYRWDDYRSGYDRGEQRELWNRLARLEQRVRYEARDGDRRYDRNGYNDRDRDGVPNQYDRYDNDPYRR